MIGVINDIVQDKWTVNFLSRLSSIQPVTTDFGLLRFDPCHENSAFVATGGLT
jgi:hypothetical protein